MFKYLSVLRAIWHGGYVGAIVAFLGGLSQATHAQSYTFKDLFDFSNSSGYYPSSVTLDAAGNLYGTTSFGGPTGGGTVYKLSSSGAYTDLFDFNASTSPSSTTVDAAGNLYGTTYNGGAYGQGNVYKIAANGAYTNLFDFNGTNGSFPSGVTLDAAGNLYGTSGGGRYDVGTAFVLSVTPEPGVWATALAGSVFTLLILRRCRQPGGIGRSGTIQ